MTHVENETEGKTLARKLLLELGIPELCIEKSISLLEKGPANGENMRGAIIMDLNGNRPEPDIVRGIRASHIGITQEASKEHSVNFVGLMTLHIPQVMLRQVKWDTFVYRI